MVTQCKTSQNAFGEGNAAAEAQSAGVEYGKRFGGKCRAVLAVNLPSVQEKVRDRAKTLNVEIWDRPILERLLNKRRTLYRDLGDLLAQPRLEPAVGAAVGSAHADLEAEAQKMSDCWENVRKSNCKKTILKIYFVFTYVFLVNLLNYNRNFVTKISKNK